MALKNYRPTTPGRRQLILVDRSDLWKGKPVKGLTEGLSQKGGRNSDGRITMRHRGGGHKRRYRRVDFSGANSMCRRPWNGSSTTPIARPSSR